jgi:mannose-6-phosphate isomerase-like protein (cupin superfamily)
MFKQLLQDAKPLLTEHGEIIYELLGREIEPRTERHSVALVHLPAGKSSLLHRHPEAEESYVILQGRGSMRLNEQTILVEAGATILIPAMVVHQITNIGDDMLEFLAICVPAWEPGNTEYLD